MSEYKSLGWQNGWDWGCRELRIQPKLPYEYVRCCDAGHKRREENIGKCQTRVYCDICWITWKFDSGD